MATSVGLQTTHQGYNFGAVLQAFALQRTIQSMGHPCTIINYDVPMYGTHRLFRFACNRSSVRHNVQMLRTFRSQVMMRKRFTRFRSRHLNLTSKSYLSIEDLRRDHLMYDVFVVGSDIVWHPQFLDKDCGPLYYLDFIPSGRRVAYAPSFGLPEIPASSRERVATYLRRFDFLSAREEAGCRIIRELTGRDAVNVLDPTLLQPASAYDKIAVAPAQNKPYILLYGIQWSDELCRLAINVRNTLGLPLVALVSTVHSLPWKFRFADKVVSGLGPAEFLGWLKHADFVCTNSFHGTTFSIIYHKRFLTTPSAVMNTRISSLLERVGLLSRQLTNMKELQPGDPLLTPIEYDPVEPRLQQAIDESLYYLRRALA
jgi:hypothetical protein